MIPQDCLFTEEHEWIRVEGTSAVVGITHYAAEQLGDVTFVERPEPGREIARGQVLGSVESVKAVSDVYAPVSGTVTEVNSRLEDEPELINTDPYGEGWICKLLLSDPSEREALLDPAAYKRHCQS